MRYLVLFMEKILRMEEHGENLRADMFLPDWLLVFGMILVCVGTGFLIGTIRAGEYEILMLAFGVMFLLVGILAIMCWRNQSIRMLSETQFEYTTFLGNKRVYRFDEIHRVRENTDSLTIFVANEKVHIEACAVFLKRLALKLDETFEKI